MGQTEPTRQADEIIPPIAGSIVVVPVPTTPTVTVIDLTTMAQTAALPSTTTVGVRRTNPLEQYVCFVADGGTIYHAFGNTAASVSAITPTATSTISAANAIPGGGTTNGSVPLFGGAVANYRMPPGPAGASTGTAAVTTWGALSPARFLAITAKAGITANLVMWVSSR